jgi:hypothetical protein
MLGAGLLSTCLTSFSELGMTTGTDDDGSPPQTSEPVFME